MFTDPLFAMLGSSDLTTLLAAGLAVCLFPVVGFWQICSKAGFTPAMSLIAFVPGGVLILIAILAFAPWPSRQLARSRSGIARPRP